MIYSMTAFARTQNQGPWGSLTCEIRSINHRYLEISLHLPEMLRPLEMSLRDQIRSLMNRGKIECLMRYQATAANQQPHVTLNLPFAVELCKAGESIAACLQSPAPIHAIDILRFPGVLETKDMDLTTLQPQVIQLLGKALRELIAARGREGEELKQLFLTRMTSMQDQLDKVRTRLPQVKLDARERLLKRFHDAKLELDANRLEQEMVIFAQKIDIAEEIERTETHIGEVRRILQDGGIVGRRLDFLLQELNREANTMGSKSTDSVITHCAVEMKVLIEQVREQVQNIE